MEKIEPLLFLLILFGVPAMMVSVIVWRIFAWWRDRTRVDEARRAGWNALDEASVLVIIETCSVETDRAYLRHPLESDGLIVTHYGRRQRGSSQQRMNLNRRMLIGRRRARGGAQGVLQPRQRGPLEAAAMTFADALGVKPLELEGWEWAWVSPARSVWLARETSEPLRACLLPGERLHLGPEHWILSLPPGALAPLLEEAAARARAVEDALRNEKPPVSFEPAARE